MLRLTMTMGIQKASICLSEADAVSNCTEGRSLDSAVNFTPIVSDATLQIFLIINSLIVNFFIMALGVTTNIVNMIVFVKLGFSDTTNISLLALTISDLGSLLVKLPLILLNPILLPDDLTFSPLGVHFMVTGVPNTWLSRTTSWLTAYIVLERYLCVVTPLKVKTLITPRRSVIATVVIFLVTAIAAVPTYYTNRLEWKFNPSRNRTILDLVATADFASVNAISYPINFVFLQIGSFFAVVVLTTALITKLASKSKWRVKAAANPHNRSHRDHRVAQMIIFICVIFIVCYIPMTAVYIWSAFDPEFSTAGLYRNLYHVIVVSASLIQGINSSVNMFVYLKMSTKYREMFHTLLRRSGPADRSYNDTAN